MSARTKGRRGAFPPQLPRRVKRHAGVTELLETPLNIRTFGVGLSDDLKQYIRERLGAKLGRLAPYIERLTARFEDVNGPRGGVDTVCEIKVVLSGLPSVIADARAKSERPAFDAAADAITRAVRKSLDRAARARRARRPRAKRPPVYKAPTQPEATVDPGSIIDRRVGHGERNLELALERPEKVRRDMPVDTSLPGVSATDRRAGGVSTARRNTLARTTRATAMLEDSRKPRPSRKSTRKSANRAKSGAKLQRRATQRARAPQQRASKAMARR